MLSSCFHGSGNAKAQVTPDDQRSDRADGVTRETLYRRIAEFLAVPAKWALQLNRKAGRRELIPGCSIVIGDQHD
jgi:hypothetical protein